MTTQQDASARLASTKGANRIAWLPWAPVLAGTVSVLAVAYALLAFGSGELGLNRAARFTARIAFVPFALAFAASSLYALWRSPVSRTLLRNRRAVGIAYGVSQMIHMAAVVAVMAGTERTLDPDVSNLLGGFGFVLAAAMTATSNDAAVRALGRNWKRLHLLGGWYIWAIYLVSYGGRVAEAGTHWAGFGTVVLIAGMRGYVRWRR